MSSFRPLTSHTLQNYPKIHIDRGSVIKPCNVDQTAADQFIGHKPTWRRILHDFWHEGIPYILRFASSLQVSQNSKKYQIYLINAIKYFALLLLYIHRFYILVYGYFYPYSLLPLDEVCDRFSRCPKWSEAVIRAFAWHPNHDRCAVALCNDYIYIYQGSTKIRTLRHAQQRKITEMLWQPTDKEVLVVTTQHHIILWRISEIFTGPLSYVKDGSVNPTYLSPGLQLIMRDRDTSNLSANGTIKQVDLSTGSRCGPSGSTVPAGGSDFRLLANVLPAPIISIQFDQTGDLLYACSPNSARIAIIQVSLLFGRNLAQEDKDRQQRQQAPIRYMFMFGQGLKRLLWAPEKNRLATATTSSFIRVFEPYSWSSNRWSLHDDMVQDFVWSKPHGRMLLIANKTEPYLYALPFLDSPQAGDVGGNKSLMKALDLTATRTEVGDIVGGAIQSLAWDKEGKRLAISFRDNPESILLYRTVERPTVEFHQLGVIQSDNCSTPLFMEFHDKCKSGSLLTICWSDGQCQHIPMIYTPGELNRNGISNNDSFDRSYNNISNNQSFNDPTSPAKTPRSLTNFCHVSGNNSISSFPSSLMPINKVQHQTTLFSLSNRSMLDASKDSSEASNE